MDRLIDLDLESLKLGLLSSDRFFQKRLIIFNSASFCGFTEQLHEFEKIYQEGHIVPIAIPTNEFGKQEPGDNYEILQYYRTKFNITFPVCKKVKLDHNFFIKFGKPDWNFNKWLFDKNHKFVKKYASQISPIEVASNE
jgi:glutathione peroxidase